MRQFDKLAAVVIVLTGFAAGLVILRAFDSVHLPTRQVWELDPQGQGENFGSVACIAAGRTPYYIYPDGITPFFEECLPNDSSNP
jgi:hypothetical protein